MPLTMMNRQSLFTQLANEPHLMHPDFQVGGLVNELARIEAGGEESVALRVYTGDSVLAEGRPYRLKGDVAIIPVHGYLGHRSSMHIPGLFTGYDYITSLVETALADDSVAGIALDVNSPGGMVSGAFEAADVIKAAIEQKPVWAIVDSSSYSAAYLISSGATKIVAPKAGGVGSIGVVTMHVDVSKLYESWGIKVTMLYAGEYKADGNPFEELSDEVKTRIEARLEQAYNLFVDAVAVGRNIEPDVVKGTKAGTYQGDSAKDIGLIDAVMSPASAYAAFANLDTKIGGHNMSKIEEKQATDAKVVDAVDETALKNEGATTERERIRGIVGSDEAKGRSGLAEHLAYETDMSVADAEKLMAASSKSEDKIDKSFIDAMNDSDHPEVGAEEQSSEDEASEVDTIVANWHGMSGRSTQ